MGGIFGSTAITIFISMYTEQLLEMRVATTRTSPRRYNRCPTKMAGPS